MKCWPFVNPSSGAATDQCYEVLFVLQCVILTEASLNLQLKVNQFCRSQSSPIGVSAEVFTFQNVIVECSFSFPILPIKSWTFQGLANCTCTILFTSLVYNSWCIWCLLLVILWLRRFIWSNWPKWRGTQGNVHFQNIKGKYCSY